MAGNKYLLAVIGIITNEDLNEPVFLYDKTQYQLIYDCDIQVLIKDVRKLREFQLEKMIQDEEEYIGLFFYPNAPSCMDTSGVISARERISRSFFTILEEDRTCDDNNDQDMVHESEKRNVQEFDKLYEALRESHKEDIFSERVIENVQHDLLKPRLRKYQTDAVRWMLNRELEPRYIPHMFVKVFANAVQDQDFYLNPVNYEIMDKKPLDTLLPSGGILADEMGLGKTVEMLALILNNQYVKLHSDSVCHNPISTASVTKKDKKRSFKCICRNGIVRNLILCNQCQQFQHLKCVQKNRVVNSKETDDNYICPQCWTSLDVIESKATLIVTPHSIKKQWESEIAKHVGDRENFRVLIYEGVSKFGWISPLDLAEFDVVIVDYNVLRSEIYFTTANSREGSLRHERKHMNSTSPLPLIKWWRVCLDEAQMVETPSNQCSKMVKTLPTTHRWAVTGTPIEKSIHNLYGLMHFLDCEPYNDYKCWGKLAAPFISSNDPKPLVKVLHKVMWRTCKRFVVDQIGIPPQTQVCHKVYMSDLQMVFYKEQHENCRIAFLEKASNLIQNNDNTMSNWNPHILKLLLEPLRKLRQDCTVPSLVHKGQDQHITKKLLSPDELFSHLVSNNEIECKAQLRTIASSLNGLAGVALLTDDVQLAIKYYKSVLQRAKENAISSITVDSLLQIHAISNLVKIIGSSRLDQQPVLDEYSTQLSSLEGKYTESYYTVMKSAENQLLSVAAPMNTEEYQSIGDWWRVLFDRLMEAKENALIEKINTEVILNQHFVNFSGEAFRTLPGIDYTLTTWLDKVVDHRNRVYQAFESLKLFTEKIKPNYVQTDEERQKIMLLVESAADCHLDLLTRPVEDEEEEPATKMMKKSKCTLCIVKAVMMEYETKIFDKAFDEEKEEEKGTWKPSYQEWIVKILHQTLKKEVTDNEIINQADSCVQLLDKYKNEYKEFSKYWVEINYTASAFDELSMCKSQLEAVDKRTLKKNEKLKRNQIFKHDVGQTKLEFENQLHEAEMEFLRIKRTLNYLKHLSDNPDQRNCPICNIKPEDKYSVWNCGHQVCIPCLLQMKKYSGFNLACPVCRKAQKFNDINFVTLQKSTEILVEGRYSAKIIRIVQEVHVLRKADPKVKILIFSQWEDILAVLKKALDENKIESRMKTHRFYESIEQFKSNSLKVTCLLLPLTYGSKGLNLVEATHVFLVEPILNPSEELQAIGRIHRIGQTRPTFVHKFIVRKTIEETIHNTVANDESGKWKCKDITVENLKELFNLTV